MIQSTLLSSTNKAIFSQSVEAMNMGLYDLALVGIVTVFDGVLTGTVKRLGYKCVWDVSDLDGDNERFSET